MNLFRFCPFSFNDLTPDQEAGSAVSASPGCLLVSRLEFGRAQGPVESKKLQRKYKTSGVLFIFPAITAIRDPRNTGLGRPPSLATT